MHERRFVDDRAARYVDQYCVRLHAGEFAFADQVPGFRREHGVNGDHVATGKQGMKIVALVHAGALHPVAIDEGVVADDVHPETGSGDARDVAADPADAHETERLAGEVRRQPARSRPSPAARLHFPLQRLEVSRKRKHQRDGAFGDRLLRVFRHVDDRDAPAPCRLDVDRVDANAVLDDALQPWRAIDDLR